MDLYAYVYTSMYVSSSTQRPYVPCSSLLAAVCGWPDERTSRNPQNKHTTHTHHHHYYHRHTQIYVRARDRWREVPATEMVVRLYASSDFIHLRYVYIMFRYKNPFA